MGMHSFDSICIIVITTYLYQMGKDLTKVLMHFFALLYVIEFLISSGARFQAFMASLIIVACANSVLPNSISFPFAMDLVCVTFLFNGTDVTLVG